MTGKALAIIDPLPPLATRPLQPLPAWVLKMWDASKTTYLEVRPTEEQRSAIEKQLARLVDVLDQTPARYPKHKEMVLFHLGEMMLAKPRRADAGALVAEATKGPSCTP